VSETSKIGTSRGTQTGALCAGGGLTGGLAICWQPWSLILIALAICWFVFFNELGGEWQINAQYSYGYAVPLLGAVLVWRRWLQRPKAPAAQSQVAVWVVGGALLLLVLPMRLIIEANPEWRLIYWLRGFQTIGLTLCLLYLFGGWPWVRFFAPPLLFTLIAVPWPMVLERWIIQNLMRLVAGLTVEVVGWIGIPAFQQGNLIETRVGLVGIDEACSGVRSLQSALMLSLFLGEMHRLSPMRRVGLLGASLVFDLLANLARTSFLVWAAANKGLTKMEAWHDAAGLLVMLIVLPSLLALAHFIKPKSQPHSNLPRPGPVLFPTVPRWAGVLALIWIGAAEMTTDWWYRSHERNLIPTVRWSVAWPTQQYRFRKTALPENSLAILRCSNSEAAVWDDGAGNQWSAFLLRWKPGKNSAQLAKGHRPDICLPAAGARLLEDFGQIKAPVHDFEIPFHHQSFDLGGRIAHVFYSLWPDRVSPNEKPILEDGLRLSRLYAVLAGKRNLGQQVLEIVIQGPESKEEADNLLKKNLQNLIRKE
jgi:exosortase